MVLTLLSIIAISASSACTFTSGFYDMIITNRKVKVFVPEQLSFPAPTLLFFHGIGSDPDTIEEKAQLQREQDF